MRPRIHTASTGGSQLRVQLWSYNYDPEPSGIAPLSAVWARAMQRRGHEVTVIAAHPHYPQPLWGTRIRPYRQRLDGVRVLRLPLWAGRRTTAQRLRQELSFVAALSVAAPLVPPPDVIVAVTPSFPGLMPAMAYAWAHRVPWVMWLQDILPDGAATTGIVESGALLALGRRLERAAYRSASRVVVISDAFNRNLQRKGVPPDKLTRIYNPVVRDIDEYTPPSAQTPRRLLIMGNIGYSQGIEAVVRAIDGSGALERSDAVIRIAGHGVARDEVAAAITTERIEMLGLLLGPAMEAELASTSLGLVTQRSDVEEFNLPSKLMNYMGHGTPVLAIVNPESETARIVRESEAGWVADSGRLGEVPALIERILDDPHELDRRGRLAHAAAVRRFAPDRIAEQYEEVLMHVLGRGAGER